MPAFEYNFNYRGVPEPEYKYILKFDGYYTELDDGSNHIVLVRVWNTHNNIWENMQDNQIEPSLTDIHKEIKFPNNPWSWYNEDGVVQIKIVHTTIPGVSDHQLWIDRLIIEEYGGSSSSSSAFEPSSSSSSKSESSSNSTSSVSTSSGSTSSVSSQSQSSASTPSESTQSTQSESSVSSSSPTSQSTSSQSEQSPSSDTSNSTSSVSEVSESSRSTQSESSVSSESNSSKSELTEDSNSSSSQSTQSTQSVSSESYSSYTSGSSSSPTSATSSSGSSATSESTSSVSSVSDQSTSSTSLGLTSSSSSVSSASSLSSLTSESSSGSSATSASSISSLSSQLSMSSSSSSQTDELCAYNTQTALMYLLQNKLTSSDVADTAGFSLEDWDKRVFHGLGFGFKGRSSGRTPFLAYKILNQTFTPLSADHGTVVSTVQIRCYLGVNVDLSRQAFSYRILAAAKDAIRSTDDNYYTFLGDDTITAPEQHTNRICTQDLIMEIEHTYNREDYEIHDLDLPESSESSSGYISNWTTMEYIEHRARIKASSYSVGASGCITENWNKRVFRGISGDLKGPRCRGRMPFIEIGLEPQDWSPETPTAGTVNSTIRIRCHVANRDPGDAETTSYAILTQAIRVIRSIGEDTYWFIGDDTIEEQDRSTSGHFVQDALINVEHTFERGNS